MNTCTLSINNQFNGIELSFAEVPAATIRNQMKEIGFRWHSVKKIWYAKNTEERMKLAEALAGGQSKSIAGADSEHVATEIVSKFGIKIGDILADSWGYSMTIVEFYMVTKIVSPTKVEIVELGHIVTDTDRGGGETVLPDTERRIGEPIVKQVAQNSYEKIDNTWHIKINSSISLTPWSGHPMYQNTWD